MTKEQSFFISAIRDHLNGNVTDPVEELDWPTIIRWSVSQQLIGIIYQQVKRWAPSEIINTLKISTINTVVSTEKRKSISRLMKEELTKNGIEYFIVKGPVVAEYYPFPDYRMMGDVDLVVKLSDLDRTDRVLRSIGFNKNVMTEDGQGNYDKQGMHLEIHSVLIRNPKEPSQACYDFYQTCWNYVSQNMLDENVHFIYVLLHLRQHFIGSGVGFRQFIDLAVMMQRCNLNQTWIQEKIDEFGIEEFAEKCFGLIKRWFLMDVPFNANISDELYIEATNVIFKNGVFGFHNEDNCKGSAIRKANAVKHPALLMIRRGFRTLFPSYKTMIDSTKFSYLKSKPFLLPYAWISRILVYKQKYSAKSGVNIVTREFASRSEIKKRNTWLEKWGL